MSVKSIYYLLLITLFQFIYYVNSNITKAINIEIMMDDKIKVSVIIPVYNAEKFLGECLDSVLNQTLPDIEVICVNDGSTDNSLKLLQEYAGKDNRVIVLNEKNCGAGISRKKGLDITRGEYVAFVDADDILDKNYCELSYGNASHNHADMTFFRVKYFTTDKSRITYPGKFNLKTEIPDNTNYDNYTFTWNTIPSLVFNRFVNIWSRIYRRQFLLDNNFYFPEKLSFNDVPLHVESVLTANRISFVDEVLYSYRLDNPYSITEKSHTNRKIFDFFKIIEHEQHYLEDHGLDQILKNEFTQMKIDHLTYHLSTINKNETRIGDEFHSRVKQEFQSMNLTEKEFKLLPHQFAANYLAVMNSKFFEDYFNKQEHYNNCDVEYEFKKLEESKSTLFKVKNKLKSILK